MEIPTSLVLERWSKNARLKMRQYVEKGLFCWDSMVTCRNWMLNGLCKEMCVLASVREDQFETVTMKVRNKITHLKHDTKVGPSPPAVVGQSSTLEGCIQDPLIMCRKKRPKKGSINRTLGLQPSHVDDVDEDNYYTPNFREEEYAHYHSQPVGQEEHFSPDEEDFQVPLTDPFYSWHR
ncbi:hypothetical protein S83_004820 [Arachis hypogaea]